MSFILQFIIGFAIGVLVFIVGALIGYSIGNNKNLIEMKEVKYDSASCINNGIK